ncbi:claudin-10-like [Toxotes jaculatrix]|uniref:claudin-10-like n=1 Tax=Toxotes jaculatrix TaxID=941984 RepID=UPI001B3AF565|nr:claudin-10-like [Toxotes jaculatrix]XP_040888062.1 claudin-10-like [Toxotes jaculatrix]
MWRRLAQILGLLLCIMGWGLVGCTLAMDHWRVAQLGGQAGSSVVVTAWYWSDLWKDCYEDSTALVNCVDFGVLWTVKSYIQAVRGLLIIGLCLGLIGTALAFFGMECTHIGGDQRSNDTVLTTASAFHLLACVSDVAGYCLYINRVVTAFLHSKADPSKLSYEIGPPLYLGLVGSFLIFLGCMIHCATAYRVNRTQRGKEEEKDVLRGKKHTHRRSERSNGSQSSSTYKVASVVIV